MNLQPSHVDGRLETRVNGSTAATWRIATGIFLIVLAGYVLSSPGRIDIIDGQARFEAAYNWLTAGKPLVIDTWIRPLMAVKGRGGLPYSSYGAPASVLAMPLVAWGLAYNGPGLATSQFLFSLTSSILGALVAPLLFLFYLELGFSSATALRWSLVSAFATLVWPLAASTFDNAQHAFFALLAVYLGYLGSKRDSHLLAFAGGLTASVLVLYQEYFLLIIPALALCTLKWSTGKMASCDSGQTNTSHARQLLSAQIERLRAAARGGEERSSCLRFLLFVLTAVIVGIVFSCAFNYFRFGSLFDDGKLRAGLKGPTPLFGNPLAGFTTLILSPGKSIFLYSPPIVLGVLAIKSFKRRHTHLFFAICAASVLLVLFLSCIAFAGGDWCWGPRYLVVLLPLWALSFPFVSLDGVIGRRTMFLIIGCGLVVQTLALSVENQRFFFERKLDDFFWAENPWFYVDHCPLLARVAEFKSLLNGPPPEAAYFNSVPVPDWYTYSVLGPPPEKPRSMASQWMRRFKIFYLPRPWPLWMPWTNPELRPIRIKPWLWSLSALGLLGTLLIWPVIRAPRSSLPIHAVRIQSEEVGVL